MRSLNYCHNSVGELIETAEFRGGNSVTLVFMMEAQLLNSSFWIQLLPSVLIFYPFASMLLVQCNLAV